MKHIGEFVYGDTGTDLVVSLKKMDGTAVDVTGSTSIYLIGQEVGGTNSLSVTGAISGDAANGQFSFEDVGNAFNPPASRPRATFECRVKWTSGTELFWSRSAFRLDLVRFG